MTSAIDLAQEALALDNYSEEEHQPLMAANIQGKPVAHWSYKVQVVGAVVGLVATVAFAILNMTPAAIVGGVLLATNIFAAYFLHKFRLYDQLEDYVKEMADRIHSFSERVEELKEVNAGLEHIDKEMEVIPQQWKEEIDKGKKELLRVHKKFNVLKKNYDAVLNKLAKFSNISKTLQIEAGSLAQETVKFGAENKLLEDNVRKIAEGLIAFQKHNENIQERNRELDQANQEFDRLEQEFSQSLEMIRELFDAVKGIYEKIGEMMAAFDQKIGEIKGALPDIKASQQDILELNKQIISLKAKVESLLSKQTELKELREFKNSRKKEFETWKQTKGRTLNL